MAKKITIMMLKAVYALIKWTLLGLLSLCAIGVICLIPKSFFEAEPKGEMNGR